MSVSSGPGPIDVLRGRLAAPPRKRSRWADAPGDAPGDEAASVPRLPPPPPPPLTAAFAEPPAALPGAPPLYALLAVGDDVLGRWSADGLWYAARVLSVTHGGYPNALFRVHYVGWAGHEEGGLTHARLALRAGDSPEALLARRRARAPPPPPAQPRAPRAGAAAAAPALVALEAAAEAAAVAAAEAEPAAAVQPPAPAGGGGPGEPPVVAGGGAGPPPAPALLLAPALLARGEGPPAVEGWRQRRAARGAPAGHG